MPLGESSSTKRNVSGAVSFYDTWTFFTNSTDQTSGGSRH
jgi:hypothetical protein